MFCSLFICRLIVKQINKAEKGESRYCAREKHWESNVELLISKRIEAHIGLVTHVYVLDKLAEIQD